MINIKEDERLSVLNHSSAHLMAQAVKHLYPQAKFWVGPVIAEGFYYDMDLGDVSLSEEDLLKIEKEMKKCAKDAKNIIRKEITKEEALAMFGDDPYKVDLIERMDEESTIISCYSQGDFTDLCRGPHIANTKEIKHFKLLKVSGAYWKGDSKNKMLQRVYGISFDTAEDLQQHLELLEEAKNRDHRKIGKEMNLFMFSDIIGKGMPMFMPDGFTVRHLLSEYIMTKETSRGYQHVYTPSLASVELYKKSGHWDHYKDDMFPAMEGDNESYVLRPMNCPHHMMMYKNGLHSYRDLPLRLAEVASDFRFEASGALVGIERARSFTQNDSHIFCTPEQIKDEFKGVVDLILDVYRDFGFKDYEFRLSLRDPEDKEKYFGNDDLWQQSEQQLREVLDDLKLPYYEAIGEAAFYGPKLDVQVKSAIGHDVTLSTIQLDYQLPVRFELSYIDDKGEKERPVVIHRAILGSLERFMAFLIEETKGNFPLWLAPHQIVIIPVHHEMHYDYALKVEKTFKELGFRVEIDNRNEKLGFRMREAQTRHIPITLVVGDGEIENGSVNVRRFGIKQTETISLEEALRRFKEEVDTKAYQKS